MGSNKKDRRKKISAYVTDDQYEMIQYLKGRGILVQNIIRDSIEHVYHICKNHEGREQDGM